MTVTGSGRLMQPCDMTLREAGFTQVERLNHLETALEVGRVPKLPDVCIYPTIFMEQLCLQLSPGTGKLNNIGRFIY